AANDTTAASSSTSERFAAFTPGLVDSTGTLPPYIIAPDFKNIVLSAPLSNDQLDFLRRNGFVITAGDASEYYSIYKKARDNYQPLFITTDSLLHAAHLAF